MKVGVLGVGHVGLVTAVCMASLGHDVVGMDDDANKVHALQNGVVPFYEPGLPALLADVVAAGRLVFTRDAAQAIAGQDVVFVCVGTPRGKDGAPHLGFVEAAATSVATHATGPLIVAEKSTVPVKTGERIAQWLERSGAAVGAHDVVSNPEFLREGTAIVDTLHPDRIVVGADSDRAHGVMRALYEPMLASHDCPYVATDVRTAELIKHASNAFLATKISFINAIARICELADADVQVLADAMGMDPRIGRSFLNAGLGYGGSCFPKDVDAFIAIAGELGYDFGLLRETARVNDDAKAWPLRQLKRMLDPVAGATVAVLGVAFKPGTDDVRDAPALDVIEGLRAAGATVRLHDPITLPAVRDRWTDVALCDDVEAALRGADAVVVCTEWDEYADITPQRLRDLLTGTVVVDGRGVWDVDALRAAGLNASAVGRAPQSPGRTAP